MLYKIRKTRHLPYSEDHYNLVFVSEDYATYSCAASLHLVDFILASLSLDCSLNISDDEWVLNFKQSNLFF